MKIKLIRTFVLNIILPLYRLRMEIIKNIFKESITLKNEMLTNELLLQNISKAIDIIVNSFKHQGQILLCGNGGSAADAQHLAAELSGRYLINRPPLNAEALHVNTSYITAVANDFSFDDIYSRLIEAKGKKGDVLIAISTSGNSKNVINAIHQAKKQEMHVIGLTGYDGGQMKSLCDLLLNIPSNSTPRIQESHILIGHIICELVEKKLYHA